MLLSHLLIIISPEGVVSVYKFLTTGTFVQKIHGSSFVIMSLIFLLAVLFGPIFCGWVCPLGSFQEWLGSIGKKLIKNKYNRFVNINNLNFGKIKEILQAEIV